MRHVFHRSLSFLAVAVHFMSAAVCLVAVIGLPIALLARRYALLVLLLVLIALWELLRRTVSFLARRSASDGRPVLRQGFTWWGVAYLLLSLGFCAVSVNSGVNLLYLTACLLLSLLLSSMILSIIVVSGVSGEWQLPRYVFAGDRFTTGLSLHNAKRRIPSVGLRISGKPLDEDGAAGTSYLSHIPPRTRRLLTYSHTVEQRGRKVVRPLRVGTQFPFGLAEACVEAAGKGEILVFPRLGTINRMALARQGGEDFAWLQAVFRRAGLGEFRSLREYQDGDSYYHIHWRTSARMRELYVREFERSESQNVLILLDSFVPPQPASLASKRRQEFEKAVSFAATLARLFLEHNVFYALASYCPELVWMPYNVGRGHFFACLEALALATTSPCHTLKDLADDLRVAELGRGRACAVSLGSLTRAGVPQQPGISPGSALVLDVSSPEFDEIFTLDT